VLYYCLLKPYDNCMWRTKQYDPKIWICLSVYSVHKNKMIRMICVRESNWFGSWVQLTDSVLFSNQFLSRGEDCEKWLNMLFIMITSTLLRVQNLLKEKIVIAWLAHAPHLFSSHLFPNIIYKCGLTSSKMANGYHK